MGSSLKLRHILRDLSVAKLWSAWTRNVLSSSVVRRCKKDIRVREVIQCFRQAILRPRRTLLFSVTAAYKGGQSEEDNIPNTKPCFSSITDEELQDLVRDFEEVEELAKRTLYCSKCDKRLLIDKKQPGVVYCPCKKTKNAAESLNGWTPFMEAEDVIIWRKEIRPGRGQYAYKVYGKYKELRAEDFAAVQIDGAYRRSWDTAVAALSVVERQANGLIDQTVLHWEVLWPRLFANRDYVYIRRHKEFDVKTKCMTHKDGIFQGLGERVCVSKEQTELETIRSNDEIVDKSKTSNDKNETKTSDNENSPIDFYEDRSSVHSRAKRIALEEERREKERNGIIVGGVCVCPRKVDDRIEVKKVETKQNNNGIVASKKETKMIEEIDKLNVEMNNVTEDNNSREQQLKENKAFIVISRSCTHSNVPETSRCVRVTEYWSNMVVQTLDGADSPGMEFVLTYYDEPAVGGMPSMVSTWATGLAAPAYLNRIRQASADYRAWRRRSGQEEAPEFTPFGPENISYPFSTSGASPVLIVEENMESSKQGPEIDSNELNKEERTREKSTQTDDGRPPAPGNARGDKSIADESVQVNMLQESTEDKVEQQPGGTGWWRYLYTFYYYYVT